MNSIIASQPYCLTFLNRNSQNKNSFLAEQKKDRFAHATATRSLHFSGRKENIKNEVKNIVNGFSGSFKQTDSSFWVSKLGEQGIQNVTVPELIDAFEKLEMDEVIKYKPTFADGVRALEKHRLSEKDKNEQWQLYINSLKMPGGSFSSTGLSGSISYHPVVADLSKTAVSRAKQVLDSLEDIETAFGRKQEKYKRWLEIYSGKNPGGRVYPPLKKSGETWTQDTIAAYKKLDDLFSSSDTKVNLKKPDSETPQNKIIKYLFRGEKPPNDTSILTETNTQYEAETNALLDKLASLGSVAFNAEENRPRIGKLVMYTKQLGKSLGGSQWVKEYKEHYKTNPLRLDDGQWTQEQFNVLQYLTRNSYEREVISTLLNVKNPFLEVNTVTPSQSNKSSSSSISTSTRMKREGSRLSNRSDNSNPIEKPLEKKARSLDDDIIRLVEELETMPEAQHATILKDLNNTHGTNFNSKEEVDDYYERLALYISPVHTPSLQGFNSSAVNGISNYLASKFKNVNFRENDYSINLNDVNAKLREYQPSGELKKKNVWSIVKQNLMRFLPASGTQKKSKVYKTLKEKILGSQNP